MTGKTTATSPWMGTTPLLSSLIPRRCTVAFHLLVIRSIYFTPLFYCLLSDDLFLFPVFAFFSPLKNGSLFFFCTGGEDFASHRFFPPGKQQQISRECFSFCFPISFFLGKPIGLFFMILLGLTPFWKGPASRGKLSSRSFHSPPSRKKNFSPPPPISFDIYGKLRPLSPIPSLVCILMVWAKIFAKCITFNPALQVDFVFFFFFRTQNFFPPFFPFRKKTTLSHFCRLRRGAPYSSPTTCCHIEVEPFPFFGGEHGFSLPPLRLGSLFTCPWCTGHSTVAFPQIFLTFFAVFLPFGAETGELPVWVRR